MIANYCSRYNNENTTSCPEIIVKALQETIDYVNATYQGRNVTWGEIHPMRYPNIPFTQTPASILFDRSAPSSGSINTINVAAFKYFNFYKNSDFTGTHSANLKIMSNMNGTVHYSLDTGISDNIMSGFYFNMNEAHLDNQLYSCKYSTLIVLAEFPFWVSTDFQDIQLDKPEMHFKFGTFENITIEDL